MTHGKQIKAARRRLGLTQKQLAAKVTNPSTGKPLTPSAISQIEAGDVSGRAPIILAISAALGLSDGESLLAVSPPTTRTLRASWRLTYVQQSGEYVAAPLPSGDPMTALVIEHLHPSLGPDVWGMVVDSRTLGVAPGVQIGPADQFVLGPPDRDAVDGQLMLVKRVDTRAVTMKVARVRDGEIYAAHPDGEQSGDTTLLHPARWEVVALVKQHIRVWE